MSINKVIVSGNLTRDAELRYTSSQTPVLNVGIAVNDRRKSNQTGEWEDKPNFFNCTMFGSRAEKIAEYLTTGTKVTIAGKLSYSSWEDDKGNKRSSVEIWIDDIEFMSSKNDQSQQHPQQRQQRPQQPMPQPMQAQPMPMNGYQQQYQQPMQAQPMQQPMQYQQYPTPQPMQQPMQQPAQDAYYDEDIPF